MLCLPLQSCHTELCRGRQKKASPMLCFATTLHPWTAWDEPANLAVPLDNVWKLYQNSLLGSNKDKLTVAIRNKYLCSGFPATGLHMLAYPLKASIYGESNKRLSQALYLYTKVFFCFTTFFSMFPTLTLPLSPVPLCCPWCFHRSR